MSGLKSDNIDVVFNLYQAEGLLLTNAYIVSIDRGGEFTHIRQVATPGTIDALGIERTKAFDELFAINDLLLPNILEERFSPPKKKVQPLKKLLQIPEIKRAITRYVDRQRSTFLELIAKNELPLSYLVQRRLLVKDFIVQTGCFTLKPQLSFQKLEAGVRYQLRLIGEGIAWKISTKEITPVNNHPAWVIVNKKLHFIEYINGNMVKPFREKDEVFIPPASVVTYFKKFIIKVAEKAEIKAEGFDMIEFNRLDERILTISQDIFSGKWGFVLKFRYHQVQFQWSDKTNNRTSLSIKGDAIRILKISRDYPLEKEAVAQLRNLGFENRESSLFYRKQSDGQSDLLDWIGENRDKLLEAGFSVKVIGWMEKEFYFSKINLNFTTEKRNDWFDIFAEVSVGEFTFPFRKLAKNIQSGDRFYQLPNGKWFVIPLEWMSKYKEFFQFARIKGDKIQLAKSQYTVLNQVSEDIPTLEEQSQRQDFMISPLLKAHLRPYQMEGVKWLAQLYRNGLGACLADDMGLGKTLQTIAILLHAKERKATKPATEAKTPVSGQLDLFAAPDNDFLNPLNALVILPASLVFNWVNELNKFAPSLSVYRHIGSKRHRDTRLLSRFDIILTTYQTALRDSDLLNSMTFEYIVLDESQHIKNRQSKVFKAINEFDANHKISLSGTPIENSLSDLWSQMQFINPNLLGSYTFFKREFINPIERMDDEPKKKQLRALVAPYLLRRTKEEVAKDLPPLTVQVVYTEMTREQKQLYEIEKSAARNYLLGNFKPSDAKYRLLVLQTITKLRLLANHPVLVKPEYEQESGKFKEILELMTVIHKAGHKALFFSSFVKFLNLFEANFREQQIPFARLSGSDTAKQRESAVRQFQTMDEVQTFLISIKAGGTGLNLTAADYVFILDPWWNPTTEDQAIARAHRIGQKKSVIALKFISKGSIEEKILKLQERKSRLAADIIGQHSGFDISREDITYLFGD